MYSERQTRQADEHVNEQFANKRMKSKSIERTEKRSNVDRINKQTNKQANKLFEVFRMSIFVTVTYYSPSRSFLNSLRIALNGPRIQML